MPSTAAPVIPPRPSRSPRPGSSTPGSDAPKVPPRPSNRRHERSTSPGQGSFAPSPLNEIPRSQPQHESDSNPTGDPLSATVPSDGQGGEEYGDSGSRTILDSQARAQGTPVEQKRDIGSDLELHAPMPSLPSSTAKAKVHAVTHTSSRQAAAAGFGTASPSIEQQESDSQARSETNGSQNASVSPSIERRVSQQLGDEHGIPEIGQQVPMYPNAGDVQAPSVPPPSSTSPSLARPNDRFEKDWQEKHPDELAREEQTQYQPDRAESALSSDELNRIVRDSASRGAGVGTSSMAVATPEEELGYIASEEFTSRLKSGNTVESPLCKLSSTTGEPPIDESKELEESSKAWNEGASLREEEGVIHIEEPLHHQHHPDGFAPGVEDESQHGVHRRSESGGVRGKEDDVPVLASDERDPDAEHMQPAVSPTFESKEGLDFGDEKEGASGDTSSRRAGIAAAISPPARGGPNASTGVDKETKSPSAAVEEYEPLSFKEGGKENEPISTAGEFKQRPEHVHHKFPSQDIWEEPPNSTELHATVTTPDVSGTPRAEVPGSPSKSLDDKGTTQAEDTEERPPVKEDAPESQIPVTVGAEPEETEKSAETGSAKPAIPPRPSAPPIPSRPQKRVLKAPPFDANIKPPSESNVTKSTQPATSPTESRKAPVLPERPKPQIPARPAKPVGRGSSESLTKVNSGSSAESSEVPKKTPAAPPLKPKPAVPARPGGSKIAALKAGLLSDLDKQLQFGPMGPKPPAKKEDQEAPAEKGPLSDARKGRARGPARRKPAVTTLSKAETPSPKPEAPEIKITGSWNVWQIDEDGTVVVSDDKVVEKSSSPEPSSSPELFIDETAADTVAHAAPEAVEDKDKDERSGNSLADEVASSEAKDEPQGDEERKAVSPESGSTPPPIEKSPSPEEPTNKSEGDEGKEEEQSEEPDITLELENKPPTIPTTTIGEDQSPEESTVAAKARDSELATTPVDEERKFSNEASNTEA